MKNAALHRAQIEDLLSSRIPAALSPRPQIVREGTLCGNDVLDELLGGGLPAASLTEFVGQNGSGRTTAALAYVRAVTNEGSVCAWIDASDTLDPESVAANGIALERLLWVRCGSPTQTGKQSVSHGCQSVRSPVGLSPSQQRHTGGGSPHPRSEGRDMPQAISSMLHAHGGLYDKQMRREKRTIGTPGAPNRPLTYRSEHREEQVNSDRLPPRRGDNLAVVSRVPTRYAEPRPRLKENLPSRKRFHLNPSLSFNGTKRTPWNALDQALRATDLLLQAGGFTVIVLDLGNLSPEFVWRIPLATWFRFRAACERTRASLLLLTQHPCARSSAETVVRMQTGSMEADGNVMTKILYRAMTERKRESAGKGFFVEIRKPPQPERIGNRLSGHWMSEAAWVKAG